MFYDYAYFPAEDKFAVYKVDGGKLACLLKTEKQEIASRALTLYEKYGHGALEYPLKRG